MKTTDETRLLALTLLIASTPLGVVIGCVILALHGRPIPNEVWSLAAASITALLQAPGNRQPGGAVTMLEGSSLVVDPATAAKGSSPAR